MFSGQTARHRTTLILLCISALALSLAGCGDRAASSGLGATGGDLPDVLATVDGQEITLSDIRSRIGPQLDRIEIDYQRARSELVEQALDGAIRERIVEREAHRRGMSMDELLAEVSDVPLEPSDADVSAWYLQNHSRVGGSLQDARAGIAERLRQERRSAAIEAAVRSASQDLRVMVSYQPFRLVFDNSRAPTMGPPDAPVTLVEFSDFECPFCRRFAPTLKRLHETFGDDLQIVYRHFPIPSLHPNAVRAAEASHCAYDQGRFWEMHDLIFEETQGVTVDGLQDMARRIGLDSARFDRCLETGQFAELVRRDMEEGSTAGVRGTPTLFLNGVQLQGGAIPYESLVPLIQDELRRVRGQ